MSQINAIIENISIAVGRGLVSLGLLCPMGDVDKVIVVHALIRFFLLLFLFRLLVEYCEIQGLVGVALFALRHRLGSLLEQMERGTPMF